MRRFTDRGSLGETLLDLRVFLDGDLEMSGKAGIQPLNARFKSQGHPQRGRRNVALVHLARLEHSFGRQDIRSRVHGTASLLPALNTVNRRTKHPFRHRSRLLPETFACLEYDAFNVSSRHTPHRLYPTHSSGHSPPQLQANTADTRREHICRCRPPDRQ